MATARALKVGLLALAFSTSPLRVARAQSPATDDARWAPLLVQDGVAVVVNRRALPRAWLVSEVRAVTPEEALHAVRGETHDELDPSRTALLELPEAELPVLGAERSATDTATVRTSRDGFIVVDTSAHERSFLVVSESYFPGWQATIDGARAAVLQTDYLLLGLPLPAGTHHVELHYTAPGARYGLVVSLLTLAAFVGLGFYGWRRRAAPLTKDA